MGTLAVGTVAGLSTALSVGYVLWTIRGGYLVASLLSSTPLWAMVDPLPVLAFAESEEEEGNDSHWSEVTKDVSFQTVKNGPN